MQREGNLLKLASKVEPALRRLSKIMAIIASFFLGAMMLLTVADVIGRYFFNTPINGAWEVIGLLLVCSGTWGLAYCQSIKGHINVTFLLDRFPPRIKAAVLGVAYLMGLVAFSLISWKAVLLAIKHIIEKGHYTDMLHIPDSPFIFMMAIGSGMLALILFVDLIHSIAKVVRK